MEICPVEIWSLPDEIICKIFSYLPTKYILSTIVDVSYRWRSIVESDLLFWKKLQIVVLCDQFINVSHFDLGTNIPSDGSEQSDDKEESSIVIGQKDLLKVSKACCLKIEGDSKTTIRPAFFVLRIIDVISKVCLDIKNVECVHCFGVTSSHVLKFLNDKYNNLSEISFGITVVWRIPYEEFSNFKHLNTLISHDYRFTSSDICLMADTCLQLKSLWVLFTRFIKNEDIIHFLEKKKDTLEEFGLGSSINEIALEKVQACQQLKVLFICDARYITEKSLAKITNLPNLKYISFHRAKFTPSVLSNWICTSTIPSQLKVLDLTDYYSITSDAFSKIVQMWPVTTRNNVNEAVTNPKRKSKLNVHWMYYNVL